MYKIILLSILTSSILYAAPAFSKHRSFSQKDGQTFKAKVMGDEYLHYILSEDNEVIIFNKESENYEYAIIATEKHQRKLAASGIKVQSSQKNKNMRSNPFRKITKEDLNTLRLELTPTKKRIKTH